MKFTVFAKRVLTWSQRASFIIVCLAGLGLWWLVGALLIGALVTGFDEPYWGWSGTLRGLRMGAKAGSLLSLILSLPLAGLPVLFASVVIGWNRKIQRESPHFSGLRAWLISPILMLPAAVLLAPVVGLNVALSETMHDDTMPDPAPPWTESLAIRIAGHPSVAIGLLFFMIVFAVWSAGRCMDAAGPSRRQCRKCGYNLCGIPDTVVCPECGSARPVWSAMAGSPREGANKGERALTRAISRYPGFLCLALLLSSIAGLIAHFTFSYSPVSVWQAAFDIETYTILIPMTSIGTAVVLLYFDRRAAFSLAPMGMGLLFGWILLVIVFLAEHAAYLHDLHLYPDQSASWNLWWGFRLPVILLGPATTALISAWWLVAGTRLEREAQ